MLFDWLGLLALFCLSFDVILDNFDALNNYIFENPLSCIQLGFTLLFVDCLKFIVDCSVHSCLIAVNSIFELVDRGI